MGGTPTSKPSQFINYYRNNIFLLYLTKGPLISSSKCETKSFIYKLKMREMRKKIFFSKPQTSVYKENPESPLIFVSRMQIL